MDLRQGLDWKAQETAQKLCAPGLDCAKMENLATKALGVLQESGVYASVLFLLLHMRGKADPTEARSMLKELHALAQNIGGEQACSMPAEWLKYYSDKIAGDLDRLLLTRAAWEQALIYTRYGAKALTPPKVKPAGKENASLISPAPPTSI